MRMRVGQGYDVHRLVAGRRLVLGGVEIPHEVGLDGHSDADVLCHAIADALLGAIGESDIGHFFPPDDSSIEGISSLEILKKVRSLIDDRNGRIGNIDCTLVAERPKILPHVPAMKANIAAALGISPGDVGVKATTNEQLGFPGREEGMCALAVACVALP
ncbi:2-C-methyl-D-erythritol 2,4-cyclodiphosphate synthase [soil metagenome]